MTHTASARARPDNAAAEAPILCLASASPRRSELLRQIGVPHCIQPADLDESRHAGETPSAYVTRLAKEKSSAVLTARAASGAAPLPVLGADTTVVIDGLVLGKPQDEAALEAMLARLGGREHEVFSAVALAMPSPSPSPPGVDAPTDVPSTEPVCTLSRTKVRFRSITPAEVKAYWASGEPCDKAGGYAVQGYAAQFIERITGSYSGIMGLPLFETTQLLQKAGIKIL